jgi:hypothetical protein
MAALTTIGLRGQDMATTKQAIVRMKALPASVQQVIAVIQKTNFGPFKLSGKCGYDSHWYCFGNCWDYTWSWEFPNYTWLKTNLEVSYNHVRDQAAQFDQAFSPVKSWMTSSLPDISRQMDLASSHMQSGKAADVKDAITQLDTQLNGSGGRLETGLKTLSGFNQTMNTLIQRANSRAVMESVLQRDAADLNTKVATMPCGADDVRSQYQNVQNGIRSQFDQVAQAGQNFGVTSSQTDQDVSIILGTVLAARGSIDGVLKNLQNATVTPVVAVQQLRLKVVAAQWQELSDFARQQLGN